jgi:hypothetical protein
MRCYNINYFLFSNVHMKYLSNEKSLGTVYYILYCNSCYKNCKYSCDYHRTTSTKEAVNWIYEQKDIALSRWGLPVSTGSWITDPAPQ